MHGCTRCLPRYLRFVGASKIVVAFEKSKSGDQSNSVPPPSLRKHERENRRKKPVYSPNTSAAFRPLLVPSAATPQVLHHLFRNLPDYYSLRIWPDPRNWGQGNNQIAQTEESSGVGPYQLSSKSGDAWEVHLPPNNSLQSNTYSPIVPDQLEICRNHYAGKTWKTPEYSIGR